MIQEFELDAEVVLVPVIDAAADVRQIAVATDREEIRVSRRDERLPRSVSMEVIVTVKGRGAQHVQARAAQKAQFGAGSDSHGQNGLAADSQVYQRSTSSARAGRSRRDEHIAMGLRHIVAAVNKARNKVALRA